HVPMADTVTDDSGQAFFHNLRPGNYSLSATGPEGEAQETSFTINRGELTHNERLVIVRKEGTTPSSNQGSVSKAALNIPDKARKEFDKGLVAFKKEDFPAARERFNKAIELYPQYSLAFVNL